ncbi:PQQ-binding-like beta-propeller repeat protein [Anaeromyxobacter oryzae]|uniref:Uncharacterized protein n=1 Tax=Anaeromyxobacter oryzae TaxID=2918170 RepID=A0ABN6MWH9_9BACT|nr:PQQ-binding-like beta-propeller repeat protein [Anaeromyxobacter oryzae]BDG05291.1 hypothetical protein AMOR_42870 [Anaeromyxobacter oryzae]
MSRAVRLVVTAGALLVAGAARAQVNLAVTPSAAGTAPLANAVTNGTASSFHLDVANSKSGTILRQIEFRLPQGWSAQGGAGPDGWTVTRLQTNGLYSIRFQVADCSAGAVGGIVNGSAGTFRLDVTPPGGAVAGDWSDNLSRITASDPCGGQTGWNVTSASAVTIPVKALAVTGSVSPVQGPVPTTATSTWTVTNLATAATTVTPAVRITPQGGAVLACTPAPASLSLAAAGAAGASATFSCSYPLAQAGVYTFGATAAGSGVSAVGAIAGPVRTAGVTASFAFTNLTAGPGDQVQAVMTFQNNTAAAVTVSPPRYNQLTLAGLAQTSGTNNPADVPLAAGATGSVTYTFDVTGVVGSAYRAQGTPAISPAGSTTNLAITPAGTVAASTVAWSPAGIVPSRTPKGPWTFTVTVVNNGGASMTEIDVYAPPANGWGGLTYVSMSPTGSVKTSGNPTDTLRYTLTVPSKSTATLKFSFSSLPAVTQTTAYPFQVTTVVSNGSRAVNTNYEETVSIVPTPIPDVAGFTILSDGSGQTLAWTNTSGTTGNAHDGVAIFRTPSGTDPFVPADFVDYSDPANQALATGTVLYADRDGSPTRTAADPAVGAYNYRVCNHDALFVYSSCTSGYWTAKGYLDSVAAPVGGWTHQLGGTSLLQPGVLPGSRVAVATNRPDVTVLDLATGLRTFDPVALASLPAGNTPAAAMASGRNMLFAADQGGLALGFDLDAGTTTWQVTRTGESFVAEITGIVKQYASAAYTAPYDTILLASKTGRLLGVRHDTGATVWTLQVGATGQGLYAAPIYDAGTNRLFVAVDAGGGVRAYDVGAGAAAPTPVAGWPAGTGSYTVACSQGPLTTDLACLDKTGQLVVLDVSTGAPRYGTPISSALASATDLRTVVGATHGYLVSSASAVQRLVISTSGVLSATAQWNAPSGATLSMAQPFPSTGTAFVAASDKKLRKLSLDGLALLDSRDVPGPATSILVGPPVFDRTNGRFVFATAKGRVFAIPAF